jgi:hypothetical protein
MLLLCFFLPAFIFAQTLSGTVSDCNGNPVPNASIYIQFPSGNTLGTANTSTNALGQWNYSLFGKDPIGNYTISCRVQSYGGSPNSKITSPKSGFYLFTKTVENQVPPFSMDFTITTPFTPSFKIDKIEASPTNAISLIACANGINAAIFDNTTVNPQLVDQTNYSVTIFNSDAQGQVLSVFAPEFSGGFPTSILQSQSFVAGNYYLIRIGYRDFCGNVKSVDGLIRVSGLPPILANFMLLPPLGSGFNLLAPSITSYPVLGNITCGIVNITQYTGNYELRVVVKETGKKIGEITINNPGSNYIVRFNDMILKGSTNYFKNNWALTNGKSAYEVIVTVNNGCLETQKTSNFQISSTCQDCFVAKENTEIDVFSERNNTDESDNLNVLFPNPVRDKAFIKVENSNDSDLTIFNSSGQVVPVSVRKNLLGFELEMSDLPSGIYFYQLKVKDTLYKGKISKI